MMKTTNEMVVEIAGEVAVVPASGLKVCRTTISNFKNRYSSSDYVYDQSNLKDVYMALCNIEPVEKLCKLISRGYIYIFPESSECIEDSFNLLLIVEDLFES